MVVKGVPGGVFIHLLKKTFRLKRVQMQAQDKRCYHELAPSLFNSSSPDDVYMRH